jgi:hypothetical protein
MTMTNRNHKPRTIRWRSFALLCLLAIPAQAKDFALFDNKWLGTFKLQTVLGAGWRARDADSGNLVGAGAGQTGEFPGANGAVGVNDDAQLNFPDAWDNYSAPLTGVGELTLAHARRGFGLFVRARAWNDFTLEGHNFPHGNTPGLYVRDSRLQDTDFDGAAKFSGADIYDAFAFANFGLGETAKMQVRIGRQTFDWGEGLFYPGIAGTQPYDFAWLSIAGAPVLNGGKLPVNRVYANLQLGNFTVDGFYNLEFRPSVFPGCGTYFQNVDNGINKGCNVPTAAGFPDQQFLGTRNYFNGKLPTHGFFGGENVANPLLDNRPMTGEPDDESGWGVSAHTFIESLAMDIGIYYTEFTSSVFINAAVGGPTPADFSINTMYPDGVSAYAISASTGVRNLTLQGQLTFYEDQPTHYGAPSYIVGVNAGTGAFHWLQEECGPGGRLPNGGECQTFFPMDITEAQFGGTWQFGELVGLGDATLTGEIDYQWNTNYPDIEGERAYRLGRFGNFGEANWDNDIGYQCQPGPLANLVVNRCQVEGFVTETAWGYKLRAATVFPRSPKLTYAPSLTWTHNPGGTSADQGTHMEDRWQIVLALRTLLYQNYYIDLAAVRYNHGAEWDPLQDKGQYTVALGINW